MKTISILILISSALLFSCSGKNEESPKIELIEVDSVFVIADSTQTTDSLVVNTASTK